MSLRIHRFTLAFYLKLLSLMSFTVLPHIMETSAGTYNRYREKALHRKGTQKKKKNHLIKWNDAAVRTALDPLLPIMGRVHRCDFSGTLLIT